MAFVFPVKLEKNSEYGFCIFHHTSTADYPLHWHEFYEIEIILSGEGTYTVDGVEYPIKKGMLFFMSPFNFHSVKTINSNIYNIMFMGEMCDKDLLYKASLSKSGAGIMLDGNDLSVISSFVDELENAEKKGNSEYMLYLMNTILAKICTISSKGANTELSKLQKGVLYIHQNFRSGITLTDVADVLNVTPSYMSRIFTESLGVTFKHYLNDIRYNYAMRLLVHSDMSATEICFESGFNDYANFSRSFKKKFGVSPGQFRNS
jgi:AraC-like DNA-binding protein